MSAVYLRETRGRTRMAPVSATMSQTGFVGTAVLGLTRTADDRGGTGVRRADALRERIDPLEDQVRLYPTTAQTFAERYIIGARTVPSRSAATTGSCADPDDDPDESEAVNTHLLRTSRQRFDWVVPGTSR